MYLVVNSVYPQITVFSFVISNSVQSDELWCCYTHTDRKKTWQKCLGCKHKTWSR